MALRSLNQWVVPALFAAAAAATAFAVVHSVSHALAHPGARPVLQASYAALRAVVAGAFAFFTIGRTQARRRADNPVAFIACAVAMGAVLLFRSPPSGTPETLELIGESIAVVACALLVISVFALGRCFGVLPEARGLVTSGPYALVRHPVYATEIGAYLGLTVAAPVAGNACVLILLLAAQFVRMRFEERALAEAFPEYEDYSRTVPALIPTPRAAVAAGRTLAATRLVREPVTTRTTASRT